MATSLQTRPAVSDGPDSPAPLLDLGARLTARQPGDRRFGAPIHAWYPVRAALARNASRKGRSTFCAQSPTGVMLALAATLHALHRPL